MPGRDKASDSRRSRRVFAPLRWLFNYAADRKGAVSPILILALLPLIAAMGVGLEASNWWLLKRNVQNAADTAALAASWNGGQTAAGTVTLTGGVATSYSTSGCSTTPGAFDCEAVGAASNAGFTNGSGKVVVYPQYLTSNCPGNLAACYKVTVTKTIPIYLVGFALKGSSTQAVQAAAYAGLEESPTSADCLLGLGTGGTDLTTNGAPNANLAGCDIQVNGSATCHGHNLNADATFAVGTDNGCGNTEVSGAQSVADPYSSLLKNNPVANPCNPGTLPNGVTSPYPQEPSGKKGTALPNVSNAGGTVIWGATPSGAESWGSTMTFCGDVQLKGNVTVNSNTTIAIFNGQLDMNGYTFLTGSGVGDTVIFTGSNTFVDPSSGSTITPDHYWSDNGTIDVTAPTSGNWSGIAVSGSVVD
jgi:Flp pilus assembly protein TadG